LGVLINPDAGQNDAGQSGNENSDAGDAGGPFGIRVHPDGG
jgi:hypothetical protein